MSFTNPPSIVPTALLASLFLNGTLLITDCLITVTASLLVGGGGLGQENRAEKVWGEGFMRQATPLATMQRRS